MDFVKKSVNVIRKLQLKNGAILATPKDGAYPYVYIRDSVIITKALNKSGFYKNSEQFYYFVNKFSKPDQYGEIFQRYDKDGLPNVSRKGQHDNTGLLLHGVYDTYIHGKNEKFLKDMWPLIKKCCEFIFDFSKDGLVKTETSIHELYRLEHGYEIWANCACVRGLYDAAEIAKNLGHMRESLEWFKKAEQIHKNIKKKMFNKKTGLFMKNIKFPHVSDSSQMAPFYFNLFNTKELLRKTLRHMEKNLWYKELGGFRRFKKFEICKDWHWYTGGSGGWVIFTAMAARFYKQLNNKKAYNKCVDWIEKTAEKTNGLFPEHTANRNDFLAWKNHEIEFNSRLVKGMEKSEDMNRKMKRKYNEDVFYWAFPLGWSHAEYILMKLNNNKNHQ